jgi:hypothetical protein
MSKDGQVKAMLPSAKPQIYMNIYQSLGTAFLTSINEVHVTRNTLKN